MPRLLGRSVATDLLQLPLRLTSSSELVWSWSRIERLLSTCEQLVIHAGLPDRFHFDGRIPPKQVHPLLLLSQLILLLSDFDVLPVALLKGSAAGFFHVVRAIQSGITTLVHQGRTRLLISNDLVDVAAVLVRLSQNSQSWRHCSSHARSHIVSLDGADAFFDRSIAFIQQKSASVIVQHPICGPAFSRSLLLCDRRFESQYSRLPTRSNGFLARRMLSALKRRIGI